MHLLSHFPFHCCAFPLSLLCISPPLLSFAIGIPSHKKSCLRVGLFQDIQKLLGVLRRAIVISQGDGIRGVAVRDHPSVLGFALVRARIGRSVESSRRVVRITKAITPLTIQWHGTVVSANALNSVSTEPAFHKHA